MDRNWHGSVPRSIRDRDAIIRARPDIDVEGPSLDGPLHHMLSAGLLGYLVIIFIFRIAHRILVHEGGEYGYFTVCQLIH